MDNERNNNFENQNESPYFEQDNQSSNENSGYVPPLNINYTPEPQFEDKKPQKGFAIAGLVLGILSIICCCCNEYISLIMGILAVVFFFVDKKQNGSINGMAIAGLVCGLVSIAISVFGLILSTTDFYKEFLATYEAYLDEYMSQLENM